MYGAYALRINVKDEKGQVAGFTVYFSEALTRASLEADILEYLSRLDPLLTGAIDSMLLTQRLRSPLFLKPSAFSGSDVQEKMRLSFKTHGNYRFSYSIPTFNEYLTVVEGEHRVLNLFVDEASDFLQMHYAPIVDHQQPLVNKRGETLVGVRSARQVFGQGRSRTKTYS